MTAPSLRAEIADNLEGLARAHIAAGGCADSTCPAPGWFRGAETLRWVEATDLDPDDPCADLAEVESEMEALEEALKDITELVDGQMGKKPALTPAKFRDAIRDVIHEAGR